MSPSFRRRFLATVAAVVVASGFFVVGAAPAATASTALVPLCFRSTCNFTNPILTLCADATSHVVREESPAWGGTVRLWRSDTCQTAWSQYYPPDPGDDNYQLTVVNDIDMHAHISWRGPLARPFVHGDQLYSPGPAEFCIARAPRSGGAYVRECWPEST